MRVPISLSILAVVATSVAVGLIFLSEPHSGPDPDVSLVAANIEADATLLAEGPTLGALAASDPREGSPNAPAALMLREVVSRPRMPKRSGRAVARSDARIEGWVVVVDKDGVERAEENGSLTYELLDGLTTNEGEPIAVEEGRFSLDQSIGDRIMISTLRIAGREVILDESTHSLTTAPLQLRGVFAKETSLRVVDARTELDLCGVTVVQTDPANFDLYDDTVFSASWEAADLLADGSCSPVRLLIPESGPKGLGLPVRVGVSGYAWAFAFVGRKDDGESLVELEPGADLTITLLGALPAASKSRESHVRLRRPPSPPDLPSLDEYLKLVHDTPASKFPDGVKWTENEARAHYAQLVEEQTRPFGSVRVAGIARSDTPIIWRGVPTGEFTVTVEIGDEWCPIVLGSTPVTLRAGQHSRVTVTLDPPPLVVEPVPLAGTLFVPEEWGERAKLSITPNRMPGASKEDWVELDPDSLQPDATSPGLFRWDAGRVRPGRYTVVVRLSGAAWYGEWVLNDVIDTGPQGKIDIALTVAPPADVVVRLRDRLTGTPVSDVSLMLTSRSRFVRWEPAAEAYRFRAPAVPTQLTVDDRFEVDDLQPLDLRPGPNTFTFHVNRRSCVEIELSANGSGVSFPARWFSGFEIRSIGGRGEVYTSSQCFPSDGSSYGTLVLTEPGTYEITVPELPGYAPIKPFRLAVPPRETIRHVIDAEPR